MSDQMQRDLLVLYVEDDAVTRKEVSFLLTPCVREVVIAKNGQEGLAVFQSKKPDLIITDVAMPIMDGLKMARAIREIDAKIPIILTTGHSDAAYLLDAIDLGVDQYVLKPVETYKLTRALEKCVAAINTCRAADEVLAARNKLQAIFDAMPDLLFELGLDGHVYEYHSPRTNSLFKPVEEIPGKTVSEILQPPAADIVISALQEAHENGFSNGKQFHLQVPGGNLWFELSVSRKDSDSDKPHFLVLWRDITERKNLENVQAFLAKSSSAKQVEPFFNALARYLAKSLSMYFVCIDVLEGDGLNARTLAVWCDDHFEDNVTYALKDTPCGDVVGKEVCCFPASVCQFFPRDQVLQDLKAESYVGVTLFSHSGRPIGLIAVIGRTTLTNRPLAEKILKMVAGRAAGELERMIAEDEIAAVNRTKISVLESISDAFFSLDANMVVTYYNRAAETALGKKHEEVIGRKLFDVFSEARGSIFEENYTRALNEKTELTFEAFFGAPYENWYNVHVYPHDEGIAVYFQLITERKQKEKVIEEKNAEMERFTYTVSHDLKSPIVTLKAYLGYLEQDMDAGDVERIKQDLGFMNSAVDKMSERLGDILELSRIGRVPNNPVRISFRELVDEATAAVAGHIAKKHVDVHVEPADVVLNGDRPRLVEIWQNLIENAVKYMGNQESPRIEIGLEQSGADTVFFVRDNGMGIDPRYKDRVFGLFDKLDPRSEGSGLGLALVKRIVELHKGKIWLETEGLGKGTCFKFTLPEAVKAGK